MSRKVLSISMSMSLLLVAGACTKEKRAGDPESPNEAKIAQALRAIHDEGGEHNFLIVRAVGHANTYVQFARAKGDERLVIEAVGPAFDGPKLGESQLEAMERLGYTAPSVGKQENFWQHWLSRDHVAAANVAVRTLAVYGVRPDAELKLDINLE
jgi:hypothetical protein